jgi:hypothetical protein
MDPMTSLLTDVAFILAFLCMTCVLHHVGTSHAPHGSTGLAMRHDGAEAAHIARIRVDMVQGREEVSRSEKPERAQRIGATLDHS